MDFAVEKQAVFEWSLRCTPDRDEYTSIRYGSTEMKITMDASHSDLDTACDRQ